MSANGAARSPAELWEAVVQAALVGTERAPRLLAAAAADGSAPPALAEALSAARARRGGDAPADPEGALLDAAAALSLYVRAGRLPAPGLTPAEPPAAAPPAAAPADADDLPVIPEAADRCLARIHLEEASELLPEWLRLVASRGWRVPALALPAVLNAGLRSDELRALVPPVLGARGRWLAAQNPEWGYAAAAVVAPAGGGEAADTALWETGTLDQRTALLGRLRRGDAAAVARARAMLASSWAQEPPKERAALLEQLGDGLGDADEPFLEDALDDRRKEVRRAAAELLARLPGSRLVSRMLDRLGPLLTWTPSGLLRPDRLHAELPGACDAAMERDGVVAKPPGGSGERAWWLAQMVAAVPPRVWTQRWKTSPDLMLRAAGRTEWRDLLLSAWARAAVRHRDAAWAGELLDAEPFGQPSRQDVSSAICPAPEELAEVLPPDRRELAVAHAMRRHHGRDGSDALAVVPRLLAGCRHEWSAGFTRDVLAYARPLVVESTSATAWGLRSELPQYALRMPPALADEAAAGWPAPDSGDKGVHWTRPVERMIALLQFRREMAKAFDV